MVNAELQENLQALWQVMADRYQHRWTSSNGMAWDPTSKPWLLDCHDLTKQEFRIGVDADEARFMALRDAGKNPFPPSSLEFRHMAVANRSRVAAQTEHEQCQASIGGLKCPMYASIDKRWCRSHASPEGRRETASNRDRMDRMRSHPQEFVGGFHSRKNAMLQAHMAGNDWRAVLPPQNPLLEELRHPARAKHHKFVAASAIAKREPGQKLEGER